MNCIEGEHCMCLLSPDHKSVACHVCGVVVKYSCAFAWVPVCHDPANHARVKAE